MKNILFWLCYSVGSAPLLFGLGAVAVIAAILATRKAGSRVKLWSRLGIIALVVVVVSGVSAHRCCQFVSHVVDPQAYQAVDVGMSRADVAHLLGEPSKSSDTTWRYDRSGVFEYAEISFDRNGKVKSKFLDR